MNKNFFSRLLFYEILEAMVQKNTHSVVCEKFLAIMLQNNARGLD